MKKTNQLFQKNRSGEKLNSRVFLLMIAFICQFSTLRAQDGGIREKWSENTAFLIPAGKWESGIFQSFRLGITRKSELRSYALLMPVLPNLGVKLSYLEDKKFGISGEHSVSYPTLFLNLVSRKGTGGLISPQFEFPSIIALSNSIVATFRSGTSALVTAHAGFSLALRSFRPDYRSSIDIPFIYQRMAHYYGGAALKSGISFKKAVSANLFFEEAVRIIVITRNRDNMFLENSGSLLWASRHSLRIRAGYNLSRGNYPFGIHTRIWPAVDIMFGTSIKKK